jgi:DNA-binding Lrp family transcriptional regulator
MKANDEIRVNLLEALLKKNSVQPNIRQIQKSTGYHKATIKSSLAFLEKEGILQGFGPKIDFRKLGYDLEVTTLFQVDMGNQKVFEKIIEVAGKDPHVYWISSVMGAGNWNVLVRHIHKDVESCHREFQKRYMALPGYHATVKNLQNFFSVEPVFKHASRTKSIVELIKGLPAKSD